MIAGVIVARRYAQYRDEPGRLYHFPKRRYLDFVRRLVGCPVAIYEPRRGGLSSASGTGGRSAYVACATLGRIIDDPLDSEHAYVETLDFVEFASPVSADEASVPAKSLQSAVRVLPLETIEPILRAGLGALQPLWSGAVREGLVDDSIPELVRLRDVRSIMQSRVVRDRNFRLRVVEQAYDGRCAISRLRLTNGYGRAEVDAAHIRPVKDGGPDSATNGIALTKTLHWAFDRGLISLTDDGRLLKVERGLDGPLVALLPKDGAILQPESALDRPHPSFLAWHRSNVFKGNRGQTAT